MALSTYSKFYYIAPVFSFNRWLDFNEGSGELSAEIAIGKYTPTGLAEAIATAMNDVGSNGYTVTFNRSDRSFTITALTGSFSILIASGSHPTNGIYSYIGLGASDLSSASSHTGSEAATVYSPQFFLQSYTSPDHFKRAVSSTVNETAGGDIETVAFGLRRFIEFEIVYSNDYQSDRFAVIRGQSGAVANLVEFMTFITKKYPFEFMPDETLINTYYDCLLESTEADSNGLGFKLTEMVDRNLAGFYKTGRLLLRVIE